MRAGGLGVGQCLVFRTDQTVCINYALDMTVWVLRLG